MTAREISLRRQTATWNSRGGKDDARDRRHEATLAKLPCYLSVSEAKSCYAVCQPALIPGRYNARCMTNLLDPGPFLDRLAIDLILMPPPRPIFGKSVEEMELSATGKSERLAQGSNRNLHTIGGLTPLAVLRAIALSIRRDNPP